MIVVKPQDIKPTKEQQAKIDKALEGLNDWEQRVLKDMIAGYMRSHQVVDMRHATNQPVACLPQSLAGLISLAKLRAPQAEKDYYAGLNGGQSVNQIMREAE